MNNYRNRGSDGGKTYYEILEVPVNADTVTIRKSYLKKSLKYHPDKNPNNEEEAKARFIEIGEAYEVLSEPARRRAYDQELRATGGKIPSDFKKKFNGGASDAQAYDNYMDAFDATVSGMSEAEIAATIGTVSALAGIIGSIVGSRVMGGAAGGKERSGSSGKQSFISSAGSLVGGLVASEIVSTSVRTLHQDSVDRLRYKEDCRRAVERGEPIPEPPQTSFIGGQIGDVLKKTFNAVTSAATGEKEDNDDTNDSFRNPKQNNMNQNDGEHEKNRTSSFMWKMAAAGVKAAQAAKST